MSAEDGFEARLRSSSQLLDELVHLGRGFPSDVLQKPTPAAFPRGSYLRVANEIRRPGFERVRIQLDWWVWPSGSNGGWGELDLLDAYAKVLLDERHWVHEGVRYYAVALGDHDVPSGPGQPLRRSRDYDVHISPAAAS